jgi:SNF2 family DNA or RNA helicase
MKCRQVANGGIYLDQEVQALVKLPSTQKKWVDLHEAKLDALEELVEELQGSPLLVAYDFQHDLERIKKRFGKEVPYIGGGVSVKRSSELEAAWNRGELPILFGHPQSMGHGLNLQECGHHIAWHSLTWDFELYDQFNRRVRRQGNKSKRVFVHHIIAEGTIDEVILVALKMKRKGQNALFSALKKIRK